MESDLAQRILRVCEHNQKHLIAWDSTLYIIESLARAAADKTGMRCSRNPEGTLTVAFPDNPRVYDY